MVDLPNGNRELADAYIRHQIYLLRYSRQLSNKLWSLLEQKDAEIKSALLAQEFEEGMLEKVSGRNRFERLQLEIANLREAVWGESKELLNQQLDELIEVETAFLQGAAVTAAPTVISPVMPGAAMLHSIIRSRPFEGRLLSEWADRMEADDIARIQNQIQMGLIAGETNYQVVRRVYGTTRLANSDGIVNMTRNQVKAVVRTAVMHVANQTRYETMLMNSDLFSEEEFDATLDSRTTKLCASLDKKRFPVGKGPYPPLHINCRSVRRPFFDEVEVGERPAKPVTEKMLVRMYAEENNLGNIKTRDALPRGTKGDFDAWARVKTRQMIGPVSADESYSTWLKRQPIEFQEEWLGKTKAKLFRDGKMELSDFVHRNGDELTLKEIAKINAEAFERAGLDTADFK